MSTNVRFPQPGDNATITLSSIIISSNPGLCLFKWFAAPCVTYGPEWWWRRYWLWALIHDWSADHRRIKVVTVGYKQMSLCHFAYHVHSPLLYFPLSSPSFFLPVLSLQLSSFLNISLALHSGKLKIISCPSVMCALMRVRANHAILSH
jgi:hypothetical protein